MIKITAAALSLMAAAGCARHWAEQWSTLPAMWRALPQPGVQSPAIDVMTSGTWGFRFGQSMATASVDLDESQVLTKPAKAVDNVFCTTGADQCSGIFFYIAPNRIRIIVNLSRPALPEIVYFGITLRNADRQVVAILPRTNLAYDLDTGQIRPIPVRTWTKLCVAAEARVLVEREIARLARDMREGKIDEKNGMSLQKSLAAYLANDARLCRNVPESAN